MNFEPAACVPLDPEEGALPQEDVRALLELLCDLRSCELVPKKGRALLMERVREMLDADRLALVMLEDVKPGTMPTPHTIERWSPAQGKGRNRSVARSKVKGRTASLEEVSPSIAEMIRPETRVVTWIDHLSPEVSRDGQRGCRLSSLYTFEKEATGVCLVAVRGTSHPPFGTPEGVIMQLVQEYSGWLWTLTLRGDPPESADELPIRFHPVLRSILAGDTEREAAERLNVSRHTIHDYVKKLYKYFGVCSRAALLTRCFAEGWHLRLHLTPEEIRQAAQYEAIEPADRRDTRDSRG